MAQAIGDGRLVAVLDEFATAPIPIHLLSPPASVTLRRTQALLKFVGERLRHRLRMH